MAYYNNMYGFQPNIDRINRQIEDLQNLKMQMQSPQQMMNPQTPAINQTFQLSNPQSLNDFDGKYVTGIDEVKNTLAIKNTLFVNKEMNLLWLKDVSGNIKSYTLTEIIELDEKDKKIQELEKQLNEMKGMMENVKSNVRNDEWNDGNVAKQKSPNVPNNQPSKK